MRNNFGIQQTILSGLTKSKALYNTSHMSNLMVNRVKSRVSCLPKATYFKPGEVPLYDLEIINLSIEELEAINLCDLLHAEQN
jgi:hypothetical protein